MNTEFKNGDVVKNKKDKNITGRVIEINGNKIKIRTKSGDRVFTEDFLEKCDTEESYRFNKGMEENKNQINKEENQITEDNKKMLNDFIEDSRKIYPRGTEKFIEFWEEIKRIIGDKPGISWKMRKKKDSYGKGSKYPGVIILDPNTPKHQRLIYLFFDDEKIQIAMLKEYINGYEKLFNIKNKVHGSCCSAFIKWDELNEKKIDYLNVIRNYYNR